MAKEQGRIEALQSRTRRPSTPGFVVESLLEENDLTQTQLAQKLGVSRATVNELLRGKRALTPDMAHRLGRFFGNGAGLWLRLQANVDLWDALHLDTALYNSIEPLERESLQRESLQAA